MLRFHTVRDTSVKVFIAILPTSIIDNWKQNMRHGGSETNETLTRSNTSTKGITLLMFEEHLVDTLLGCLFQSSLLPPSTRHSLHCQNERSRQPIAKMRLIQVISMPRTNQSIRITSHPPTRLLYIYIYQLQCNQRRFPRQAFRPLQTTGRAWILGAAGAETRPSFCGLSQRDQWIGFKELLVGGCFNPSENHDTVKLDH